MRSLLRPFLGQYNAFHGPDDKVSQPRFLPIRRTILVSAFGDRSLMSKPHPSQMRLARP